MLLALLIAAQTGAIDPGEAPQAESSPTTLRELPEELPIYVGEAPDPSITLEVDPSQIAPPTWPTSNIVLPSGSDIAVIPVTGLIYNFTHESLERRVDKAIEGGATLIVIELDTPGGVVTSALKISKYIKTIPVPTVAWYTTKPTQQESCWRRRAMRS